uniref:Uncharacterized protein n=1 Tax=Arundo donax TaxID=35708 RepID=A0A0A8YVM2_ARUDO
MAKLGNQVLTPFNFVFAMS